MLSPLPTVIVASSKGFLGKRDPKKSPKKKIILMVTIFGGEERGTTPKICSDKSLLKP